MVCRRCCTYIWDLAVTMGANLNSHARAVHIHQTIVYSLTLLLRHQRINKLLFMRIDSHCIFIFISNGSTQV